MSAISPLSFSPRKSSSQTKSVAIFWPPSEALLSSRNPSIKNSPLSSRSLRSRSRSVCLIFGFCKLVMSWSSSIRPPRKTAGRQRKRGRYDHLSAFDRSFFIAHHLLHQVLHDKRRKARSVRREK